ncbi:hypothetical protein HDU92_009151 [Lobulomyces angularis]|nr:hypothetical protein HDU92_009151 [Lobulomyces angularis]
MDSLAEEDRDAIRLWRVYKTVHEMVHDRHYSVSQAEIDLSLEDFKYQYFRNNKVDRQAMTFLVQHNEDPSNQLLVFFTDSSESIGIKEVKKICEKMVQQSIMKGIVIYQKGLTPSANKVIQEMQPKYHLEPFSEGDLLVNITKHILVPQHVPLSPDEKKTLLHLKDSQLPRIQPNDAVAKYYGLKRGQVVRIVRNSETAGK